MAAQRVGDLGALADQQVARALQAARGLLGGALDRHEAHVGLKHGRVDGPRVAGIRLVAPHEGLHIGGRQQAHAVPHRGELAGPVMRAAAGLNAHQRGPLELLEKRPHLLAAEAPCDRRAAALVLAMHLKHALGDIEADRDRDSVHPGGLPLLDELTPPSLAHRCRQGGRPPSIPGGAQRREGDPDFGASPAARGESLGSLPGPLRGPPGTTRVPSREACGPGGHRLSRWL